MSKINLEKIKHSKLIFEDDLKEGGGYEKLSSGGRDPSLLGLPEWETLIKEQGGFGKIQYLAFFMNIFLQNQDGYLVYNLTFLLLEPKFDCKKNGYLIPDDGDLYKKYCKPDYFCHNNDVTWTIDWSDPISLNNWIKEQDMQCYSHFLIGLFGMLNFTGFCLSTLWTPKLLDTYGRKKTLLVTMGIQFCCKFTMLFLPQHSQATVVILYILMFINGCQQVARASGCYSQMIEMAPQSYHSLMGSIWNLCEGFVFIILTVYFRYISKDWRWSVVIGLCEFVIGYSILLFVLPESPKWLYEKKRYKECQKALMYMSKFNNGQGDHFTPEITRLMFYNEGTDPSDSQLIQQMPSNANSVIEQAKRQSPLKEIWNTRHLLINIICMSLVWLSASFCYYLISYQVKYLNGSIWINNVTTSVAQMLAFIVSGIIFEKIGLKKTLYISYVIPIVGMVSLTVYETDSQILLSLFILGSSYGVSQVFNLAYVGNFYLFEVHLVATSFSICNLFSRFCTIFSPYVAELQPESLPKWIFTAVCLLALAFVPFITEKRDMKKVTEKQQQKEEKKQQKEMNKIKKLQSKQEQKDEQIYID